MSKLAVWLSGKMTYAETVEVLERVGHMTVSTSSVWRLAQRWGERFRVVEEMERKWGGTPSQEGERRKGAGSKRMGVAMDGGMIHIRDEGWKELKVGSIFDVGVRKRREAVTQEWMELGHAEEESFIAHLGGPEEFGKMSWAEARRRGWERATATEALGDGAPWIWNLVQEHFYDSCQVVDWYHAAEHLGAVARMLYGEETEAAKRWYQRQRTTLYQGHALRIAKELEAEAKGRPQQAEALQREAGYFRNNYRRMQYLQMREEKWAIGSGMVESGVKRYKMRFCGAGMRWSREGAERLLSIRTAVMSRRFDETWHKANALPSN